MSKHPDPSWSAEKMARYLEEKYGPRKAPKRVSTAQTPCRVCGLCNCVRHR